MLLMDLTRILIRAAKAGQGDFVNVSYTRTKSKTHYDHGLHMFGMTLCVARVFHQGMDAIESDMCRLVQPGRGTRH